MRGIWGWLVVIVVGVGLASCDSPAAPDGGGQSDGAIDAAAICAGGAADGTECGSGRICIEGACVANVCGDGFVDPAFEQCDDGNETAFDGCEPGSCVFTCDDDDACDDGNTCTGAETCDPEAHVCIDAPDPADGTDCTRADPPGAPGVCRAGACAPPGCGNGAREGTEECDDGNTGGGDGCENDCTFTCSADADCADGDACNGAEICDLTTHVCQPAAGPAADGTACTSTTITSGICIGGGCVVAGCANGFVEPTEDCDDGNAMDGDGCDNDCTFSCTADTDCVDADPCDGAETCDVTTHICLLPTSIGPDGTTCTRGDGSDGICLSGICAMAGCGNAFVEPTEDCEDGNEVDGDGCDSCQFSCETDEDCTDGVVCNGTEICDLATHICQPPAGPAEDGHDCSTDPSMARICVGAVCVAGGCGNTYLETGEDCDDGNTNQTDGCKNDCTFTCTADADCSDGNDCDGAETCDLDAHTCGEGTPLSTGTSCTTSAIPVGVCVSNTCIMAGCGNGYVEPDEECDDANTTEGDGCDNDCTFSCTTAADCDDGNVCTGAETCDTTTHTCQDAPDLTCTPSDACHTASCDPSAGCQDTLIDADGDGHAPGAFPCSSDCNDANPVIYFGAEELCDSFDNNCNGAVDETSPTWYIDCDRDGYATDTTGSITSCTIPTAPSGCPAGTWTSLRPSGASTIDCDDGNAARDPGNLEIVGNEVDNDCNGGEICYRDNDNDGARTTLTIASSDVDCDDPGEEVSSAPLDCNDANASVRPGITEVVGNNVDDNCNGQEICYRNADGDGYRTTSTITSADSDCNDPGEAPASRPSGDCDDSNATIYPGALELCDAINQNCSGGTTEGCPSSAETYGSSSNSPIMGSTAGAYGVSACPSGTVMIGIDAYTDSGYVNGLRAVCRTVYIDQDAGSPEYVYTLRTTGSNVYGVQRGLTSGTLVSLRCGTDAFVRGLHAHANATRLRSVQAYCGIHRWTRSGTAWIPSTSTATSTATAGSAVDTHYDYSCPSGRLGRTLFGDVNDDPISGPYPIVIPYTISVGVQCQYIDDMPQ